MSSLRAVQSAGADKEVSFCAASEMVMKRGPENELFYIGFGVDLRKLLRYGVGGLY
jgi:hypothetical protein